MQLRDPVSPPAGLFVMAENRCSRQTGPQGSRP